MKVKAKISFGGLVSMRKGEEREISDEAILSDLLSAGYVKEIKTEDGKTDNKKSEGKKEECKKTGNKKSGKKAEK